MKEWVSGGVMEWRSEGVGEWGSLSGAGTFENTL